MCCILCMQFSFQLPRIIIHHFIAVKGYFTDEWLPTQLHRVIAPGGCGKISDIGQQASRPVDKICCIRLITFSRTCKSSHLQFIKGEIQFQSQWAVVRQVSPLNRFFFMMGLFYGLTSVHGETAKLIWLTSNFASIWHQRYKLTYSNIIHNINKLLSGQTVWKYWSCLSKTGIITF